MFVISLFLLLFNVFRVAVSLSCVVLSFVLVVCVLVVSIVFSFCLCVF